MKKENLQEGLLVTDEERTRFGIGVVERIEEELIYVWYDEVETLVHYTDEELKFLKSI